MTLKSPCHTCDIWKSGLACASGCKRLEEFYDHKHKLFTGTFTRHPEITGEYCKEHGHYKPCAHCPVICPHCGMDINKPDGPRPWGLGK